MKSNAINYEKILLFFLQLIEAQKLIVFVEIFNS